jgi:GNAT superfamily N-acetyltransferase
MTPAVLSSTSQQEVTIRAIDAQDTLDIRHAVLWPERARHELILEDDSEGTHVGAYVGDKLVSVISLFTTEHGLRFRKFATLDAWQGKGIGTRLLQHTIDTAASTGTTQIWCDARVSAKGFYQGLGFEADPTEFFKDGIAYTVMRRRLMG